VCKLFCQATYPQQFGNKKLVVSNFGNSYLLMLIHRPRIRINGFYSVSTLYSKAPNHDNFWEEKRTMSVEVRFYRHLRFYNNGRVLYSLDIVNPWDIAALLGQGRPIPKKIFEGTYAAKGREVIVSVNMAYCLMQFYLVILDGKEGYSRYKGSHSILRLTKHVQVVRGITTEFPLPINADFRFFREWDWGSLRTEA
jgi:hypothetical protein